MMSAVCQILARYTYNLLFFSNDVQTTAIAVAVTGSLCCSIGYALVYLVTKLNQTDHSHVEKQSESIFSKDNLTISHLQYQLQKVSPSHITSCCTSNKQTQCFRCGNVRSNGVCAFNLCDICCIRQYCAVHKSFKKLIDLQPKGPKHVDLSRNCMDSVPDRLGFIGSQLTFLNLSDNKLKALPDDIGCLIGLEDLLVKNNYLSTIPITLGTLPALCDLDLRNNKISIIPDTLWQASSLKYLNLENNDLKTLSDSVGCLTNLQVLCIGSNQLRSLPVSLGKLFCLQILSIFNNPISALPKHFSSLINLQEFNASSCLLTRLPKQIGSCRSLQKMYLQNNRLIELPYSIGELEKLVELNVCSNKIPVFPSSMENMTLLMFHVDRNPLVTYDMSRESVFKSNYLNLPKVPSLKELCARQAFIFRKKHLKMLPHVLQDMFRNLAYCVKCNRPVFQHRVYDIEMGTVGKYPDVFPLLFIYCSSLCRLN